MTGSRIITVTRAHVRAYTVITGSPVIKCHQSSATPSEAPLVRMVGGLRYCGRYSEMARRPNPPADRRRTAGAVRIRHYREIASTALFKGGAGGTVEKAVR